MAVLVFLSDPQTHGAFLLIAEKLNPLEAKANGTGFGAIGASLEAVSLFCSSLLILFLVLYYHNTLHNEG
jgi:hypothetical protein